MLICTTCQTVAKPNTAQCPHDQGELREVAELPVGALFDGYRIVRKIGVGGMGRVYEAEHISLGRRAALKVLLPRYAKDQEALRRFLSEAKVVNLIKHQNIVNIYDISTAPSGDFYFVMELLEGQDLSQFLQSNPPLDEPLALGIFTQIARALWAAHQKGVIHRDLKPANVFLVPKDDKEIAAKLLDFGLAKLQGEASKSPDKGPLLGTPHYMAPEYIRGAEPNPTTDQYAFGVMLYRALTGVRPFDGKEAIDVFRKQLNDVPKDPQLIIPQLRTELCQLIMRTLQKEPERRFPDMGEIAEALSAMVSREDVPAPQEPKPQAPKSGRVKLVVAAAVALLLGGVGYVLLSDEPPPVAPRLDEQERLRIDLELCTPEEKLQVIAAIGKTTIPGAVPLLSQLSKESDLNIRQAAIVALGTQKEQSARETLNEIWKNTKNVDVAAALLSFGDASSEVFLKAALNDPARRFNAALALTTNGIEGADKILSEALERGLLSPELSISAAAVLLPRGNPLAKKLLQEAVTRNDGSSASAAAALASFDDEDAKQWLVNRSTKSFDAALALASIGDSNAAPLLLSQASSTQEKARALFALASLAAQRPIPKEIISDAKPMQADSSSLLRCAAHLFLLAQQHNQR
jgi:serine/threonine protein kinase